MTTAFSVRARQITETFRRPASLNSLPDFRDDLEARERPDSDTSGLFASPGNFVPWSQNSDDAIDSNRTYCCHSNVSVSFLGSRIRRQYRSSFLLSDDQMVGVTRCETFNPEDAKADLRVSLSLQGPPNESLVPSQSRLNSASSRIRDIIDDNRGWARLMLTTDRPKDSELLGRIGSRNYFAKSDSQAPYFHRRIIPMYKDEEYIFVHRSSAIKSAFLNGASDGDTVSDLKEGLAKLENVDSQITYVPEDVDPSTERVEKDTYAMLSRHQGTSSSVVSRFHHVSLTDKEFTVPHQEPQAPLATQLSDYLPSTERSESIIHLKRSKSESSIRTPWMEPLRCSSSTTPLGTLKSEAGMASQAVLPVDNTLSLNTDFDEDEDDKEVRTAIVPSPVARASVTTRESAVEETASASSLSFVSATNGVMLRLNGPDGQEYLSSYYAPSPMRSTILYTTLQTKNLLPVEADGDFSSSMSEQMADESFVSFSEKGEAETSHGTGSAELTSVLPLPRERRRIFQRGAYVGDASQTDDSQTETGALTKVSVQDDYAGWDEQSLNTNSQLTPKSKERSGAKERVAVSDFSPAYSSDGRVSPVDRTVAASYGGGGGPDWLVGISPGPAVLAAPVHSPRASISDSRELSRPHGRNTGRHRELGARPEAVPSGSHTFRSPFDPRSEDSLVSTRNEIGKKNSSNSGRSRRHRNRKRLEEDEDEMGLQFRDEVGFITGIDQPGELGGRKGPQPAPRRPRQRAETTEEDFFGSRTETNTLRTGGDDDDDDDDDDEDEDSWVDEESRLRPPTLPVNLEAALAELPVEDPATRTKRLRPLQYALYANVGGGQDGVTDGAYHGTEPYGDARPLKTMDQNTSQELPDTMVVRTRRRTMSGVTGFLPRTSTLSSSSTWFGDHAVPTKRQIYAAEHSPLRLSSIQLQAQAEIARRRSRNNLAVRSLINGGGRSSGMGRSRSLERFRAMGPSASTLYGPTGRRVHGGAPLVERAIKRHESKRDGYETLSLVHVPRLEDQGSSVLIPTDAEQREPRRRASSASLAKRGIPKSTSRLDAIRSRDEARSLVAQAAVDLAVHTYDASEV